MPCYHPLSAFRSQDRSIVFKEPRNSLESLRLPCGQCVGCRLERSRQWAIRCVHEASLYQDNCFITLTFSQEHLPANMSLDVSYFQKFMKRLRKRYGSGVRFYHCGEYGERFGRPHYHACLFNFDFPDKYFWRRSKEGHPIFRSPSLEALWPFGLSEVGTVTFQSAAYVARYIMKKVNGRDADDHYSFVDPTTGEIFSRKPEYTTMSRRPGIGKGWFDKFSSDVYPSDVVIMNGKRMRPPRYYDTLFELESPFDMESVKFDRHVSGQKHVDNNSPERLAVREQVQLARLEKLPRSLL